MNAPKPYEKARWVIPGTIFFGFLVNALSHAFLLAKGDPLVKQHRGTLQFRSAWIGDGVLLPVINLAAGKLLAQSDPAGAKAGLAAGTALSTVVTGTMHVMQAKQGLVNWSMPEPWRWNALGYYHFAFMWLQLAWVGFAVVHGLRNLTPAGIARSAPLAVIGASLGLFAVVLKLDYPAEPQPAAG